MFAQVGNLLAELLDLLFFDSDFLLHLLQRVHLFALVFLGRDRQDIKMVLGHLDHILLRLVQLLLQQKPKPHALILVELHLEL